MGISFKVGEGDLKGLCDGVGREDWVTIGFMLGNAFAPGRLGRPGGPGNLDGTVPARARLTEGPLSGVGSCTKSGKPSVGDSGMFSLRGVEFPLVGGPAQGFMGGKPATPS